MCYARIKLSLSVIAFTRASGTADGVKIATLGILEFN